MDDAGTEHPQRLGARRRRRDRRGGRGRGARRAGPGDAADVDLGGAVVTPGPRQHAPSPVPDPHARASPAGRPLHLAARAVSGLGRDRRGGGVRGRPHRPRGARALGLHDGLRPPLRLPARPRRHPRGGGRRRRASSGFGSSRRAARWTSASPTAGCRPTSSSRSSTRCSPRRSACTAAYHETGPGARVQIAVAPCSPFSVTGRLMEESAALARRLGLVLHTHLAETVEEEAYCRELYGCSPVEYLERLGWLAGDVWCAHCVHLSDGEIARFAATGTGVAHCPTSNLRLGAGVAPVRRLVGGRCSRRARRRRLGVERAKRPLHGGQAGAARRPRARRREAMTAREALRLGNTRRRGGARSRRHRLAGAREAG